MEYITTAEAAQILGVSTWTLSTWAKNGRLGQSVPPPRHPVTGLKNHRAGWKIDASAIQRIKEHGMNAGPATADAGPASIIRSEDGPNGSEPDGSTSRETVVL